LNDGTTASGKTTVGAGIKFMRMVSASTKKLHIIASKTTGTAEKNIIQQDNGLLDLHSTAQYFGNGDKDNKLPHIKFEGKIIYVLGYDNKDKWQNVLGSQFGCVYIDEINTADIEFVREISTRNDYLMATLNPDDPSLPVYREFVNRSRPYSKYACDVPKEIMAELTEEPVQGWRYWFFTFRDNLSLTAEDIERKKAAAPKGTKLYKNKILGLRGRATGLIFDLQKKNVITLTQAQKLEYVRFSAALDTAYSQTSPDTIAFTFIGITADRKCVCLDERVYNNRELKPPLSPSDIPPEFERFLEVNRAAWGFARDVYIDSADQATITECMKYKRLSGSIYNFIPAFKKTKIIDRIHLQAAWLAAGDFLILDGCKNYIAELNIYSWKEDKYEPEDGNDHCINSCQYAWLPYKSLIGGKDFEDKRKGEKDDKKLA
jgi:PBSX family phage terminase large subunit